ncbi:MAG TPA: hypothetical protein VF407_13640 [Polyangiaceae bacterium]
MRTKLFFALALPLPFALFVACGSGTESGGPSGNDDGSDASQGADIGSPKGADGSTTTEDGGTTSTGDGAIASGDSGAKDAAVKKDATAPAGKTDGGDCIGNGGDPMTGYEFQCGLAAALSPTPCTSGHNDCSSDECCYVDPTSDCVKANGPLCVQLTGF